MCTPKEIAENYLSACRTKAALPLGRMFLLACLAGAFVALAGVASTAAAATVGDPSLAKLVSGCVFPAGLAMVIVAGSELFTGNNLMIMGVLARTITVRRMLRNWLVVYLGNFAGAVLVAALCVSGHVFSAFGGKLAASVIAIAQTKAGLTFCDAFVRGSCASPSGWQMQPGLSAGRSRPSFSRSWRSWLRALSTASPICTTLRLEFSRRGRPARLPKG